MSQELMDTYITHPCSSGAATEVAATRIHTHVPQTCQGQMQVPLSAGWGKPLFLTESLLASLPAGPGSCGKPCLHLWAAWNNLPECPGMTAAPQAGTSFPECSWETLQNIPYKRERIAAVFGTSRHLALRALAVWECNGGLVRRKTVDTLKQLQLGRRKARISRKTSAWVLKCCFRDSPDSKVMKINLLFGLWLFL